MVMRAIVPTIFLSPRSFFDFVSKLVRFGSALAAPFFVNWPLRLLAIVRHMKSEPQTD